MTAFVSCSALCSSSGVFLRKTKNIQSAFLLPVVYGHSQTIHLLTHTTDQDKIFPLVINTISSRHVMRIKKKNQLQDY